MARTTTKHGSRADLAKRRGALTPRRERLADLKTAKQRRLAARAELRRQR